uniref:Uncharacterized protein n=1 Tax=Tanacetum cinerariifolium TaxID=118510 RepID=A0A6L2LJ24_TANCI|nr:hypothetical protein [Tanacetum cinerariifolium]
MSQLLKFSMVGGVRIGKGTALAADEVIPHHTTLPLPSGSSIPEKSNHQEVVELMKRKKTTFSFALPDSKADESNRSGFGTHHSASPLNTIIPNEGELATGLILKPVNQTREDTDQPLDNAEYTTEANSHLFEHSPQFQQSTRSDENTRGVILPPFFIGHGVSSTSGGSHRLAFLARHPAGNDAGSSLRMDAGLPEPFVPSWNLTTHLILNDAESFRDMMINLATPGVRSQQSWLSDYQALQRSWFELGRGALAQIDILQQYESLTKDYREVFKSHWSCRDKKERIKQLEADLASKTSSLAEAEGAVDTLKGDLEHLTVDLSQAEIVRHNYVRQLLLIVVQRLLSSDEYKKSLSDDFNLAIVAGWSEGVKAACSEEEA